MDQIFLNRLIRQIANFKYSFHFVWFYFSICVQSYHPMGWLYTFIFAYYLIFEIEWKNQIDFTRHWDWSNFSSNLILCEVDLWKKIYLDRSSGLSKIKSFDQSSDQFPTVTFFFLLTQFDLRLWIFLISQLIKHYYIVQSEEIDLIFSNLIIFITLATYFLLFNPN